MNRALRRNVGVAGLALLASSATLVCCVLPALLVSLGAGAVLVGLISAAPQLVWLSEHKILVFGVAAALLFASGAVLWNARRLPCPSDPVAARACRRLRSLSHGMYLVAMLAYAFGAVFAFLLPALS